MTECFDATGISKRNLNLQTTDVKVASGAMLRILKMDVYEVLNSECVVYIHVNKSNRKCYIGATINSASYRFENGRGYKSQKAFSSAIRYHGWDIFDSYIIAFTNNREQLNKVESQAIQYIGGHRHHGNYNMSLGGEIVSDNGKPIVAVHLPTLEETYYSSGSEAAQILNIHLDIPADVANKSSKRDYHQVWSLDLKQSEGQLVKHESHTEAAKNTGVCQSSVSSIILGKRNSKNGFWFTDNPKKKPPEMGHWGKSGVSHAKKVPVLATSISTGNEVYFGSAKEAAETLAVGITLLVIRKVPRLRFMHSGYCKIQL